MLCNVVGRRACWCNARARREGVEGGGLCNSYAASVRIFQPFRGRRPIGTQEVERLDEVLGYFYLFGYRFKDHNVTFCKLLNVSI